MEFIWFVVVLGIVGLIFGGKKGGLFALRAGIVLVILGFGGICAYSFYSEAQHSARLKEKPKFDPDKPYEVLPSIEIVAPVMVHLPKPKKGYAYSTCVRNLTTMEFDKGLVSGRIENHELVRVLEVNSYNAKLLTAGGDVGWVWHPAACLTTLAVDFEDKDQKPWEKEYK